MSSHFSPKGMTGKVSRGGTNESHGGYTFKFRKVKGDRRRFKSLKVGVKVRKSTEEPLTSPVTGVSLEPYVTAHSQHDVSDARRRRGESFSVHAWDEVVPGDRDSVSSDNLPHLRPFICFRLRRGRRGRWDVSSQERAPDETGER